MSSDTFVSSIYNNINITGNFYTSEYTFKEVIIVSIHAESKSDFVVVKVLTNYNFFVYFKCINKTNVSIFNITEDNINEHLSIVGMFYTPKQLDHTSSVLLHDSMLYISGGIERQTSDVSSSVYIVDLLDNDNNTVEMKLPIGLYNHKTLITYTGDLIFIGGNTTSNISDDAVKKNNAIRVIGSSNKFTYSVGLNVSALTQDINNINIVKVTDAEYLIVLKDEKHIYTIDLFKEGRDRLKKSLISQTV